MPSTTPIILIVDDLAANRETLRELLDPQAYRLIEAADGPTALQLAAESPPDLVLLDVMMPGMDGFEVCRRLRADVSLNEVPVILITALEDQNSRLTGLEAGADDFITKPYNRAELRARVRTITRLNRYRRLVEIQRQLQHVQRLEVLGTLAAGIAHDFNNALAPIVMGCALVRLHVSNPSGLHVLDTIERSATRSVALVHQLLSFTRGTGEQRAVLQVRHLLREVGDLTTATFPKDIIVELQLPGNLWTVRASASQLHQVFLNLCVNARDAMPQGGTLVLKAMNRTLDTCMAAGMVDARPGKYLAIEVGDTGTGIPSDVLAQMWEPFYTTKGEGKGTGLGLSTVRGIVHQHAGFVTVQTRPGHGATFTVYLPATDGEVAAESSETVAPVPRGTGELLLVVDDDDPVREFTAQVLIGHGYEVVTARDGAEAIAVFAPRVTQIRLLLTDLQMPMLGGVALAVALRRLQPALPIITMSGVDSQSTATQRNIAAAYLAKPFQAEALLSLVHRLLHHEWVPASTPPTG